MSENQNIDELLPSTEIKIDSSISRLKDRLSSLRTGQAHTSLLDSISVKAYGSNNSLQQVASVTVPEPRMLLVQPWDKSIINDIASAISASDLGLNPIKDADKIRIMIPELTEERRKDIAKLASQYGEEAKIAIRGIRRDAISVVKKLCKDKHISEDEKSKYETDIQNIIQKKELSIQEMVQKKQNSLMS